MRILFILIILGFACFVSYPVMAAEGRSGEINLTTQFQDGLPAQSKMELKSEFDWNWMTFIFDGRFTTPKYTLADSSAGEDGNSAISAEFGVPFIKNLVYKTAAREDNNYWKVSRGLAYDWRLFKWFNGKLTYEDGSRDAVSGGPSDYAYTWEKGTLSLGLDFNFLGYDLDYSKSSNNYRVAVNYSSNKESLVQKLFWRTKRYDLTLSYQEVAADFPYDLTRPYWKEKWDLNYKQNFSNLWQCVFNYSQMHEDKGFNMDQNMIGYQDYNNANLEFIFKANKTLTISIRSDYKNVRKLPSTDDFPGDWEEEDTTDTDTSSHIDKGLALEYRLNFDRLLWDIGFFSRSSDYIDDEKDKMNAGFYMTLHYKMKPADLVLKLSPQGDPAQTSGSYQLRLQYKF